MPDPTEFLGAKLVCEKEWTVTRIDPDGTVTLGFYATVERTLIVGDFIAPDPAATKLYDEIKVSLATLCEAVDCGLIEVISPEEPEAPDAPSRKAVRSSPPSAAQSFGVIVCADWAKGAPGVPPTWRFRKRARSLA